MTPRQFLQHLDTLPKAKLDALVKMVLKMPADSKTWSYASKTTNVTFDKPVLGIPAGTPLGTDSPLVIELSNNPIKLGPKSLPTAIEWMRRNGIIDASMRATGG